ncbi:MAG: 16S rRNA (guanine(966)-N(2))-methyltransferase RsmD [Psychrobacter sp.]|nr:16S rRNA (guanine(966)-N(2))-methyltransferase RsmD [Psychrobacter sp.]
MAKNTSTRSKGASSKSSHTKGVQTKGFQTKGAQNAISQVRIIAGQFKRRQLGFIEAEGLRPTPDRLRETVFNWLTGKLYETRVLDCCAGSGVLGFEALSRGANHCVFIEANAKQSEQLLISAQSLKLEATKAQIITGQAQHVLTQMPEHQPAFDVVFIDPPYHLNLWLPILNTLIDHHRITTTTLLYIEADQPLEQILTLADSDSPSDTDTENHQTHFNPSINVGHSHQFICLKSAKVGQVYAGVFQWLGSDVAS